MSNFELGDLLRKGISFYRIETISPFQHMLVCHKILFDNKKLNLYIVAKPTIIEYEEVENGKYIHISNKDPKIMEELEKIKREHKLKTINGKI